MRVFHPNSSSCRTAANAPRSLAVVREPPIQLTVEHINRLRLVLEFVILAEQTRRFACRFENQRTPGRLRLASHGRSGHSAAESSRR